MHLPRFFPAFALLVASLCAQTPSTPTPAADPHEEPAQKPRNFPALTPAELAAIDAAVPARARAVPARPRRLLVFNRTGGFVHASIPHGDEALRRLGEKTGAFSATITDDIAAFSATNLAGFDAVVFNNTTRLAFNNPAYRRALLDFVASGKGVAGLHAATDNFPTWPEGQALLGGIFHSHPWNAKDVSAVKLDEPAHILNSAFHGSGFWIREEIYQITGPYGRDRQRVLLSLDMSRPENARPPEKIQRTDNDFPISWIKSHGKGRVFYSSLGHNKDIFSTPEILQHFLDGLQFTLGDLPADAVPSASLPAKPVPALAPDDKTPLQDRPSPWTALAAFSAASQPDPGPHAIKRLLLALSPAERLLHEPRLVALVADTSASTEARREALRLLLITGGPAVVPAAEKAAATSALFADSVATLTDFATPAADAARLRLLASAVTPSDRVLLLNSFAARPAADALESVASLATSPAPVGPAAISTLAAFATPAAVRTLGKFPDSPEVRSALLAASDRLLRLDPSPANRRATARIASRLLKAAATAPDRIAAARLLIAAEGRAAASKLLPLLQDPAVAADLARSLALVADARLFAKLSAVAPSLPAPTLTALYAAAGERRSAAAVPLLTAALGRADDPARPVAALALGRCADASAVKVLLPLLSPAGPLADAARDALSRLPSPATDDLLRNRLASATPETAAALLRILAARQDRQSFTLATAACSSADATVRSAAFDAVATLVRPGDLAAVANLVSFVQRSADRREWRRALFSAAASDPDGHAAAHLLSNTLASPDAPERPAFIGALSLIQDPAATAALSALLEDPDLEKRKEVVRALASARTEGAFTLLLAHARRATDAGERILALRGYLDTLPNIDYLPRDRRLAAYREAWPLAERIEEKQVIIDAARRINGAEADAFVKACEAELAATPNT